MIQVDIEGDLLDIPVLTPKQAANRIDSENEDRQREAEEANAGGDMDDFRYLRHPWFLLDTNHGQFVAQIASAGGGGRASAVDDGKDFCTAYISYHLHYRVDSHAPQSPEPSPKTGSTQQKENL